MFIGREHELATLDRLHDSGQFQMVVLYGRRRVGKTTLLDEFGRQKRTLFFTAQEKSAAINLQNFSRQVYEFYGMPSSTGAFDSWSAALAFISSQEKASPTPLVFVFDEFPYAAVAEPSLPSALQIAIDHEFSGQNILMVLCGSNESFMEGEVLGRKSPLFGRRTAQIHLEPFDYLDCSRMIGSLPPEQLVTYFATFGGTPYYLARIDSTISYEENVCRLMFDTAGILYEEPLMLLRQELREPALYSSVLDAIAGGATSPKRIAEQSGVSHTSIAKYLETLNGLGIIVKERPLDSPHDSRKSIYRLEDPFFAYWYRFVSPNIGAIEAGAGEIVMHQLASGQALQTYVGKQFERVCLQWIIRQNREGNLPFLATSFGTWWGPDPSIREQVDIDVIAANRTTKQALFGECKWRESFDESATLKTLEGRARLLPTYKDRTLALFSKHPVSSGTADAVKGRDDVMLVPAEQLYQ